MLHYVNGDGCDDEEAAFLRVFKAELLAREWLTMKQACELLGYSRAGLTKMMHQLPLTACKIGRRYVFSKAQVINLVNQWQQRRKNGD